MLIWHEHAASTTQLLNELQYHSKVSYHPLYRFSRDKTLVARDETLVSRDETLVSREPLWHIFWNTFQAITLWDSDEILVTRWSLPCESIWYFGNCFTRCFKRNERRLTSEKPKWKRWKLNVKDVLENLRSAVTSLYFCIAAHWLRINMNTSFWMETCFARPNTIIASEETGWKQFLQSQIETWGKVLVKSTSCFRIIFSPWRSEFAYVCLTFELAFESKLIVFVNKLGCKQS